MTHNLDVSRIRADELTKGDIILHLGQTLEIYTEPRYTRRGMVLAFEYQPCEKCR
ncbi:MAG: hypothetical protein MK111_19575 [Crocosphaera sp.]|uniref:hypothetical protein n=1 Tax=Crocosphaera TaxID=263510 RepID=UPI000B2E94CD|nr:MULTISPECIES: hypothetical protein [Crocosphaera]MCH2246797.1 hypothetical protein [Crocosphaera sp.]